MRKGVLESGCKKEKKLWIDKDDNGNNNGIDNHKNNENKK